MYLAALLSLSVANNSLAIASNSSLVLFILQDSLTRAQARLAMRPEGDNGEDGRGKTGGRPAFELPFAEDHLQASY